MSPSFTRVPAHQIESEIGILHEQLATNLYRYAALIADEDLARDAVQETFLRYFVQRQYGREIACPRAWLYQVMRNYLRDRMGAASAKCEVGGENLDHVAAESHNPETLMEATQTAKEIAGSLSQRELKCLQLRTEGLSYEEIGVTMGVRTGTVGAMLSRAHEKIRRRVGAGAGELGLAKAVYRLVGEGDDLCIQT